MSEEIIMDLETNPLTEALDHVQEEAGTSKVYLGEILISLNHKGFGSLMLFPSLVAILPTGAIPGVPAVCGVFLFLIGLQVIMGRNYPWIPKRLEKTFIKRNKLKTIIDKLRPTAAFIDQLIKPRLNFMSRPYVDYIVAILCMILGVVMIVIGFIPLIPTIVAVPVLFFALGTSAKDGLLTLLGLSFTLAAFIFILWMSGFMGGEDQLKNF